MCMTAKQITLEFHILNKSSLCFQQSFWTCILKQWIWGTSTFPVNTISIEKAIRFTKFYKILMFLINKIHVKSTTLVSLVLQIHELLLSYQGCWQRNVTRKLCLAMLELTDVWLNPVVELYVALYQQFSYGCFSKL